MRGTLTDRGSIKRGTRTDSTAPYAVNYAENETDVRMRLVPLNQSRIFSSLGQIPSEVVEIWVDGIHSVIPGDEIILNSVTYQVDTVESHRLGVISNDWFHKCMCHRRQSS